MAEGVCAAGLWGCLMEGLSDVTPCRQPDFPKLLLKLGLQLVLLSSVSERIFWSNRFQSKLLTV